MMTDKHFSRLFLRGIELTLNLGWPDAERAQKQSLLIDIILQFATPPKACLTDNLTDTICYDELIKKIVQATEAREYRLIEHLAWHIYQIIQKNLSSHAISVSISKKPAIPQLTGGVVFTYGDKEIVC
jgi:dihydroneopterin aldolase